MTPATIRAALAANKDAQGSGPRTAVDIERAAGWPSGTMSKYLDGRRTLTEDAQARIRDAFDSVDAPAIHAVVVGILEEK